MFRGDTGWLGDAEGVPLIRTVSGTTEELLKQPVDLRNDPMEVKLAVVGDDIGLEIGGIQVFTVTDPQPLAYGGIHLGNTAWGPHTMVQGLTNTGQYFHIWILDATTAQASDYAAADFVL